MRKVIPLQENWFFQKNTARLTPPKHTGADFERVTLPHTWNRLDGQDGGMDYARCPCWYFCELTVKRSRTERVYLEFLGANSICTVYANGKAVAVHKGGFSTFRCEITKQIRFGRVKLAVLCDNSENNEVYPQTADFTFFGGLYRPVNLLVVPESHFNLDNYGTSGLAVTPKLLPDGSAEVLLQACVTEPQAGQTVRFRVADTALEASAQAESRAVLHLQTPHLWNGREDPYLYTVTADLLAADGAVLDTVTERFGVRSFSVDPEKGFFLNGKPYPLHGVSRHQDRLDMGWAITEKEHKEDMELIAEIGANTIRLAHYQHSGYFYDLCDTYGMIVWAEIPFISHFMDNAAARENTISQMRELVLQNYNHPSIVCWGIANEITIGGEAPNLTENLETLNALCHELDPTRLTTIAQLSMLEMESPLNNITDLVSYNHYFGWYIGEVAQNGPWLDEFHAMHPNICLGVSEYGCEGILQYHNDAPQMQDYSEEYQAYYHEKMLETFQSRPYLWSTHVWNMFDFASDMRDEGGVKGRNNKGLVTYDRKIKKDSFYIYKAYWTQTPFVHLCGRRYVDRPSETVCLKVYSNCRQVTLFVNGEEVGTQAGDKIFCFAQVPLQLGENTLRAVGTDCADEMVLCRVTEPNPTYALAGGAGGVQNWFEQEEGKIAMTFCEDAFSVRDKLGDIMKTREGAQLIAGAVDFIAAEMHMTIGKGMLAMVKNFTVEKVFSMAGSRVPQSLLPLVNALLQQVAKPNAQVRDAHPLQTDSNAYSVYDTIAQLCENAESKSVLLSCMQTLREPLGLPANEGFLQILGGFTPHQLSAAVGDYLSAEAEQKLQDALQAIAK